ncbi:MAG: regulatory protein RecX [Sphingomicrobium sp.]
MALTRARRTPPPLTQSALDELAVRYVGRYATTRAKLRAYLKRKLRERGWAGEGEADIDALASRFSELGYIDDASYALSKSRALSGRGYGKRRLAEKLREAGVDENDSRAAFDAADAEAVDAALRFARRRRIGPFAVQRAERPEREKWIAAMLRAGHGFALARAIASLAPGATVDPADLRESNRFDAN